MKEVEARVERLENEIKELRGDIKGLVEAWNTARGITTFVKWLAGVATAVVFLWNLMTHSGGHQ